MGGEGRVRGVPAAEALLRPPSDAGSILQAARPPHPALSPGQRGRGGKRGPAGDRASVDFALGASNFDLSAQLHNPVRWDAKKFGRVQGEVSQKDEQPIPPSQENEWFNPPRAPKKKPAARSKP